jgi:hypothetical protein
MQAADALKGSVTRFSTLCFLIKLSTRGAFLNMALNSPRNSRTLFEKSDSVVSM